MTLNLNPIFISFLSLLLQGCIHHIANRIEVLSSKIVDSSEQPHAISGHKVLRVEIYWLKNPVEAGIAPGFLPFVKGQYCEDLEKDRFITVLIQSNNTTLPESDFWKLDSSFSGKYVFFINEASLFYATVFQDQQTKGRSVCLRIAGGVIGNAWVSDEFVVPVPK